MGETHLNDVEYYMSLIKELCQRAKLKKLSLNLKPLSGFEWFKVLMAVK
jgi:hypothetical protein